MKQKQSFRRRLARWMTIVLAPPYMSMVVLLILGLTHRVLLIHPKYRHDFFVGILFLAVIPAFTSQDNTVAFPRLQLPQRRKIAFIASLVCYIIFAGYCIVRSTHPLLMTVGFSYLITVVLLIFTNCFFRASGHASGVGGPIILFHLLFQGWALLTLPLFPLLAWARLATREHDLYQVLAGFGIGLLSTWGAFMLFMP